MRGIDDAEQRLRMECVQKRKRDKAATTTTMEATKSKKAKQYNHII